VADVRAERRAELLGDAAGNRCGGDAPRLRVADQTRAAAAGERADLRQLGRLPGAGLATDDDDGMTADRLGDLVATRRNRQVLGKAQRRKRSQGRASR